MKTSDAVKLSSGLPEFVGRAGECDVLVVVLAGGQAAVQTAEEPSEQVALGGGVPVAVVAAAVVVGAGRGGEGPEVAGGVEAVVLDAAARDRPGFAGGG